LKWLTIVGTAAMLWGGGSIIVHALEEIGVPFLAHAIHGVAAGVAHLLPEGSYEFVEWLVTAAIDGLARSRGPDGVDSGGEEGDCAGLRAVPRI